ncbi:biphenyl-2,3-diol 1,2-dioxygenase [Rhodococcus qingshengii]|jgi:2,3-dihydroxybiphenyl 1,2-dioxygenase|uniref:2,3-dihydroxybiphenyl 1,2-dioxygenase n=1 Tax=Rhodococcus erythropolis TaxID=1833 RepID=O69362_RHOER|nr:MULTISPECIES: biphenyl-2,3-diol 1,2-dioxygenase [Rhodococcus]EEN90392.1 2,3-dihydroxybiphenyl 1,2-dioxygenase [Rhodococcus erythropolis SK121]ANQ70439.1 2,3-dihydroxybiphenyl 1,2-dioxygenase [Rhodococcus sp. 008]ARE36140.1 2,3-dihydroxybiphenyl 1,2-dioxygenase [Rhodococcus sp. BH4]AUS34223.1 biphenyl-2,3-diol 1,2-dioxygenase [Rhodococcus qingshengii]AZI64150.1 biphenyl-2,3-diol 1,2-dioxygenase [Rhodococcus sp. NJ-530]
MTEIRGLGYLRIQTQDVARWRELVVDGLGLAVGSGPEADGLYLRLDERRARLIVLPGETDKALAVGWEVRDQFALQRVREAVEKAGVEVEVLSEVDASYRDAEQVIAFDDPNGNRVEVFFGPVLDHSPLVTPHGGRFVTGDQGLGHVVLPVTRFDEAYTFYTEVLGFLPRGSIRLGGIDAPPPARRVRFMGVNQRHHSLALCPAPPVDEPGLVHLMMEAETLDAVGQALDRVAKLGFSISSTLGRHTNDKMVSFYVRAPGGWDLEFGCEGMLVDEAFYTAEEITADSYWGHDWSESEPLAAFTPKS